MIKKTSSKIYERKFKSFDEFWNQFQTNGKMLDIMSNYIFRGQSGDWELLPSLYRNSKTMDRYKETYSDRATDKTSEYADKKLKIKLIEYIILQKFYVYSNSIGLKVPNIKEFENSELDPSFNHKAAQYALGYMFDNVDLNAGFCKLLDIAIIAQHYGVPTRLLDWTTDIFTALYFAAEQAIKFYSYEGKYQDKYIVIWALNRNIRDFHSFGPSFSDEEKEILNQAFPIKFIIPDYSINSNVCAQKGILTYWNEKYDPDFFLAWDKKICENGQNICLDKDEPYICKFLIPSEECPIIAKILNRFNYTTSKLFPSFDGVKKGIEYLCAVEHAYGVNFLESQIKTTCTHLTQKESPAQL